ncbi:MAG: HAD hydrolase family protein [Microthrixaceae bacterium]
MANTVTSAAPGPVASGGPAAGGRVRRGAVASGAPVSGRNPSGDGRADPIGGLRRGRHARGDPDKSLSPGTVEAVARLHERGIVLALTSGRPPRGMEMFTGPLELTEPLGAFNGGAIVTPGGEELRTLNVVADLVEPVIATMRSHGLFPWLYSGRDWYVTDERGCYVAREAATVDSHRRWSTHWRRSLRSPRSSGPATTTRR